jgi:hypothetical protein
MDLTKEDVVVQLAPKQGRVTVPDLRDLAENVRQIGTSPGVGVNSQLDFCIVALDG